MLRQLIEVDEEVWPAQAIASFRTTKHTLFNHVLVMLLSAHIYYRTYNSL